MSSITQFPFPSGTAPESQVVEWIAEVIDPKKYQASSHGKRLARVRVQGRIRYARKIKKDPRLRKLENGHINVSQFFGWAVLQKTWGVLAEVDGLPRDATVDLEPVPATVAMVGSLDADEVPTDIQKLRGKYVAEHRARLKAEARVEELEAENKQLKDQLLSKAERSRLASEDGKRGGRGNEQ
jgi:hypothetical protein